MSDEYNHLTVAAKTQEEESRRRSARAPRKPPYGVLRDAPRSQPGVPLEEILGGRERQAWSQASSMPDSSGGAEEQEWPSIGGKAAHHFSSSSHVKLTTKIFA